MKLCVYPDQSLMSTGGVKYVIADLQRLLNNHKFISQEKEADLTIVHAASRSAYEPDITWTHGLLPASWGPSAFGINEIIFSSIASSLAVVAPSNWGGALIEKHTGVRPTIIHNGIFHEEYKKGGKIHGPILWPKTTINPTCNPNDFIWLAQHGIGTFESLVKIHGIINAVGMKSRKEIREYLASCSVFVATTKENDSVMVMEAMAIGIPVLGWRWGMLKDRLTHKMGCYLAEPGNLQDLLEGLEFLQGNWKKQSEMARIFSGFFDWKLQKPKIEALLADTLEKKNEKPSVTIVIPCHNYGKFVGKAIQSAMRQTVKCEVIVVDDCSTDNSLSIIGGLLPDKQIVQHSTNLGVSRSRNDAIRKAKGNFIVCLDADDELEKDYVETVLEGFKTRDTAICYTPIRIVDEKNVNQGILMFTRQADIIHHMLGANQVPSCCMFRKLWWERADGYDEFIQGTEDANLWLKMFILGGKAKRVTMDAKMLYRTHPNNMSKTIAPPWNIFRKLRSVEEVDGLDFGLFVVDRNDLKARHAYWRLKGLQATMNIGIVAEEPDKYTPIQLTDNYLMLEAEPQIVDTVQRKLEAWKQLF